MIGLRKSTTTRRWPVRLSTDHSAGAGAQNRENGQLVHQFPSTFHRQADRTMIRSSAFAHKPVFVPEPGGYSTAAVCLYQFILDGIEREVGIGL